jgi:hypothetical protein
VGRGKSLINAQISFGWTACANKIYHFKKESLSIKQMKLRMLLTVS